MLRAAANAAAVPHCRLPADLPRFGAGTGAYQWRLHVSHTKYVIYLVDPASSHMLVSKIKPCMSQYKLLYGETANGSLKQLSFIWWSFITWITMVILELIHAPRPDFVEGLCLLGTEPT